MQELRELPYNLDAEQALLGAIMTNDAAYWETSGIVDADMFFEPVHADVYAAMAKLAHEGRKPVPTILAPMFEKHEGLQALGGKPYIARLAASAVSVIACKDYAESVREAWLRREMINIGNSVAEEAFDLLGAPANELADRAEEQIHSVLNAGTTERTMSIGKAASLVVQHAADAYERGKPRGLKTGLKAVDDLIGPMQAGDMIVLGGATSQGKTALAQQIGFHVAGQDKTVLVYSLEMSGEEYTARHVAQLARVPATRIEEGQITEGEYNRLVDAQERLAKTGILINETPGLKVSQMRSYARRLQRRRSVDLIIIDHLQFVGAENQSAGPVERVEQKTRDIKATAKELGVPILLISHINRSVSGRDDKTPQLADLHGGSAIEKDADVVFFIHREEYWIRRSEPHPEDLEKYEKYEKALNAFKGLATVVLAKRRRGAGVGKRDMHFEEEYTHFTDIDWRRHG